MQDMTSFGYVITLLTTSDHGTKKYVVHRSRFGDKKVRVSYL